MARLRGWLVVFVGLVAFSAAGWWVTRAEEPSEEGGAGFGFVLPVTLAQVERRDVQPRVDLSGTVRSARRARLGFDADGILATVDAREADAVEAGRLLATLDARDAELELAAAEASLALATRELELLLAGERDEDKRRLEAQLAAAEAEADLAGLEVERGEKLLADRVISQSEHDRRRTAHRAADQRRVAVLEELSRARAGSRAEDVAIAEARIEETRTRVATAKHAASKAELRAPWDGAVVERLLSVGDFAAEGDPVFELVDLDNLEVHVEIPGRFASRVSAGAAVRLALDGATTLEARLSATIPAADELARSFRGIVRLGPDEVRGSGLRPGMFARLELLLAPVSDALAVPSDCILVTDRGTSVVRAVPGGGAEAGLAAEFVAVRPLAEAQGWTAVAPVDEASPAAAPLAAGDRVVLVGVDRAFPGAPLAAREEGPE